MPPFTLRIRDLESGSFLPSIPISNEDRDVVSSKCHRVSIDRYPVRSFVHVYVNPTQRVCALVFYFLSSLQSGNLPCATLLFCFESISRRRSYRALPLSCSP